MWLLVSLGLVAVCSAESSSTLPRDGNFFSDELTKLHKAASHAKLDASNAAHAAKHALEELRMAETTFLFTRRGNDTEGAVRWVVDHQDKYMRSTQKEIYFNKIYHGLLDQLQFVKGGVEAENSKTTVEHKITRERTQMRQFYNLCRTQAQRACPNHGQPLRCLKSRTRLLNTRCRLMLSKSVSSREGPTAVMQKMRQQFKGLARGLKASSGIATVRKRCRTLIRLHCPQEVGERLLTCLTKTAEFLEPQTIQVHGARCFAALHHITHPEKIKQHQELHKLRKQTFRTAFCTKQISVVCGGLAAHTVMQCGTHSERLPPRCHSTYANLRNEAHLSEMESPNKSAAVARVLEDCKLLANEYCSTKVTSDLLQCLEKAVPAHATVQSRCVHALSSWKSQTEVKGSKAVQAGQLFECSSETTNRMCVDGFALTNGVTYGQKPSIEARHVASVLLRCKQDWKAVCPRASSTTLATCLVKKTAQLAPECQKAVQRHRHFTKWQKVSNILKASFSRCKRSASRYCPAAVSKENKHSCLMSNFKHLPSSCRKQLELYAQLR